MASEAGLLGYGNPLLDISVTGTDEFLKKFGPLMHLVMRAMRQSCLRAAPVVPLLLGMFTYTSLGSLYDLLANNAILAEDKHKPMYQDMIDTFKEVEYVPGGATQNTIRVAQCILQVPNATTIFGCVGKDKFGEILSEKAKSVGVNVKYQYTDKEPTGTCAVICTGTNRSLCAYLAAANLFTEDHLDVAENWALVEKAKVFYCASFPLTVCPGAMMRIAKHSHEQGKTFTLNLSAPFLAEFFKEPMLKLLPYVDILFGNETEAQTFAKVNDLGVTSVKEIAFKMADLPKENSKRSRMVVFTQGCDNVLIVKDGKCTEYPVIPIPETDIVDCNGAGDAFVGGFLAQYVQGKEIGECVRCGNFAANIILKRSGCTFPEKLDFN